MSPSAAELAIVTDGRNTLDVLRAIAMPGSMHDSTRCQLAASFLLSLWQLSGRAFTDYPPSFLLVNGGEGEDPVLSALQGMLSWNFPATVNPVTKQKVAPASSGPILERDPELGRQAMLCDIQAVGSLSYPKDHPASAAIIAKSAQRWQRIKPTLFPRENLTNYSEAWDPDFGLVTGADGMTTLLVANRADIAALAEDLAARKQNRLDDPRGFNDNCEPSQKTVTLQGSLPAADWHPSWLEGTLRHNIPFLFLPHSGGAPPELPDADLLGMLTKLYTIHRRGETRPSRISSERVTMEGLAAPYELLMRARLADLPTYFFTVLKAVRDLQYVAHGVVRWASGAERGGPQEECTEVAVRLYIAALRGITYGIEALRYLGFGMGLGELRADASTILAFSRGSNGVTTRSILVKYPRLQGGRRDQLLERLAKEGLVSLEKRNVRAVGLSSFLAAFAASGKLPDPRVEFHGYKLFGKRSRR